MTKRKMKDNKVGKTMRMKIGERMKMVGVYRKCRKCRIEA
jgi:hypothetical protein